MITKYQIAQIKDQNNQFKHLVECHWNETSLSKLYDKIDAQIEGGALIDIVSQNPISYDKSAQRLLVELVLDASDLFNEDSGEIDEE